MLFFQMALSAFKLKSVSVLLSGTVKLLLLLPGLLLYSALIATNPFLSCSCVVAVAIKFALAFKYSDERESVAL